MLIITGNLEELIKSSYVGTTFIKSEFSEDKLNKMLKDRKITEAYLFSADRDVIGIKLKFEGIDTTYFFYSNDNITIVD